MSNQYLTIIAPQVEQARKILQHEQRTNHQDRAIRPGGLEAFTTRWYEATSKVCQAAGLDVSPLYKFVIHLEGYHDQDPLQRAISLRAALAQLNALGQSEIADESALSLNIQEREERSASIIEHDTTLRVQSHSSGNGRQAKTLEVENNGQKKTSTRVKSASKKVVVDDTEELSPVPALETLAADKPSTRPSNPIQLEAGMSQGHTALTLLSADVTAIPGVGPSAAQRLHHLGIWTVRDLLFYFPREHRDYSKILKIAQVPFNELTTTMGLIWDVKASRTKNGRMHIVAEISDETGKLYASWFNQTYLHKQLQAAKGEYLVITGIKQRFGNKVEFSVRTHELPERGDLLHTGRLVPIYGLTEGLYAKTLLRFTKYVVDRYAQMIPEHLPASLRLNAELITLPEAVAQMHYPDNEDKKALAYRRLAFDELFLMQLGMQERRSRWKQEVVAGNAFSLYPERVFVDPPQLASNGDALIETELATGITPQPVPQIGTTLWSIEATDKPLEGTLPFLFTEAQRRVICEILEDLAKDKPMCRLLQGDVGAGKTAVAAAALFTTALNGYQGAIMAPTEILAEQHARSIGKMLEPFGMRTVLLTGSMRVKERQIAKAALERGEAVIAVGTHALIQDDVSFHKLGLVIIDEQHRFGVEQRDALRKKGHHPHMLVMTATPIPRTLALTLYGDLDVSIIDQLPPGRQKIITRWRTGNRRGESYKVIKEQIEAGHQAFIICPLVEESEVLEAKAAVSEYERLKREVFPNQRLGLLHGAMKPAEKDAVMNSFRDKELDILVATSVIEVGIDIPNATVMVIEDADRFGLSQLHQFRGRVGRGKAQSYCYVLSAEATAQAQDRLGVFQETDDGFKLAEEDLKLRGPGDFIGVRQSGMPELKVANFSDTPMIELTKKFATKIWEQDPYLHAPEHAALREKVRLFWQNFVVN